jgi:hypothetical protein
MKLPDFHNHQLFNELLQKMGAELVEIKMESTPWQKIDTDDLLGRLNSIEGILVENIRDIKIQEDGTFEYKGQKVLVYIRDQRYNPRYGRGEYKFHISNCETINRYIQNNRFDRYVVSTRTDGKFLVNIKNSVTNSFEKKNVIMELKVCKNCLLNLSYKGYRGHYDPESIKIYNNFKLKEFFSQYSTRHTTTPTHTDTNAPDDLYPDDFEQISRKIREECDWTCQNCGIKVKPEHRNFLHIHHINGVKSDNKRTNLKCLCIKCHAEQPDHEHLQFSPDYFKFRELYP